MGRTSLIVWAAAIGWNSSCVAAFAFSPATSSRHGRATAVQSVPDPLDVLTSGLASIFRFPGGTTVRSKAMNNKDVDLKLQILYDIENDNECRQVRECITELDLVVAAVVPAAPNSRVFVDNDDEYYLPPGTQVPRLVLTDQGNELMLQGAAEIVAHLQERFGMDSDDDDAAGTQLLMAVREVSGWMASLMRIGRGTKVVPAAGGGGGGNASEESSSAPRVARPAKPLILYNYEGNQFCRLVREVLTELDLAYELRSTGKQSPRRDELAGLTGGSTQCPYLIDPNTKVAMSESADICKYLYQTYATFTPPNEVLQWASDVILTPARPLLRTLTPLQAGSKRDDPSAYDKEIATARAEIETLIAAHAVVVYTFDLSPFSIETKALLDRLNVTYHEESLGTEWLPGLMKAGGAQTRAALLEMSGQSSLPHIFVGGVSIGGLYSGTPGLVPSLEQGKFLDMVVQASRQQRPADETDAAVSPKSTKKSVTSSIFK